jgi:DNA polymerase III epsilon subunit-like protein
MPKFAIFDTETTGIPKHPTAKMGIQPKVIEFGGLIVDDKGVVLQELELLFNPEEPLEEVITKITGLKDEDLIDQPTFPVLVDQLKAFFKQADVVIAHNLPFDTTMIDLEMKRHNLGEFPWPRIKLCTVQELAEEWGRRPKLLEVYESLEGKKLDQKHRALDDVYALLTVCRGTGILDRRV